MSIRSGLYNTLFLLLVIAGLAGTGTAQEDMPEMTGFLGEFVGQIQFVQGRITQLEQAFPQDKFSWRPGEGVRSVSEVFMHIAAANYLFIKTSGYEVPAGMMKDMKPQEWEKTATGKDEIQEILDRSFTDITATVKKITVKDLEKSVHVFGMDMSLRNFMLTMLGHMHEHLGQAIAYARTNGIVPPWTAERMKKSSEQ